MIPGLSLVEKIVGFAIDIFVRSRAKRAKLKKDFNEFFEKSGDDSTKSAELHKKHKDLKKQWAEKDSLKS